jgi:hypothetical protein
LSVSFDKLPCFALSHPKFREALAIKCPCLGIGDKPPEKSDGKTVAATT